MQPSSNTHVAPIALGMTDMIQAQENKVRNDYNNKQLKVDRKMAIELEKFEELMQQKAGWGKTWADVASDGLKQVRATLTEEEKKPALAQNSHKAPTPVVPVRICIDKVQPALDARSFASVVAGTKFVKKEFEQYAEGHHFHQGGAIFPRKA